jgi:predicted secreted Zn-dependent protease
MKRSNPSRVLLAAVVAAAGCAGTPTTQPVNQSGYSTAFRQGYAAGCDSVGARRPQRDEARYKTDTDYMMGWNDGYSICVRK